MDFILAHHAIAQLAYQRAGAERDFIHAVAPPDHQRTLRAEALQHTYLDADQIRMEHAHQDVRRAGWIGQRPEDVEDGANTHLATYRCNVLHRRMMDWREHETDAGFGDALRHLRRLQVDGRAEGFEHIGTAGT